ncbi:hypothetical protein [Azospirillum sp.]|uniref:hypothetical protein n=1 Tax=Azospirillum sp. TaxID=34012 RepID=UPI003D73DE85
MSANDDAAGLAALSICESVLLLLVEKGVVNAEEARAALEDAAAAHRREEMTAAQQARHKAAEHIIERMATQVEAARPRPGRTR